MRLLIVEDDLEAAAYMAKGLKESGYVVDHVADGREALYRVAAEPYDAVVVDRMLPGVDGLTIVRTMRSTSCAVSRSAVPVEKMRDFPSLSVTRTL